jgi:hypothetical protein
MLLLKIVTVDTLKNTLSIDINVPAQQFAKSEIQLILQIPLVLDIFL